MAGKRPAGGRPPNLLCAPKTPDNPAEVGSRGPVSPPAAAILAGVAWDSFLAQIGDWLAERGLYVRDARWVVGVSGGPDSTLLLHVLRELSVRHHLNWQLHVAHLHHGLRGAEADADAGFVRDLAARLNAAFHEEKADIRAAVEREGGSTEEVARRHRYAFLERVALRAGSESVAVAHHADDNVETLIHRVCRGTGLRGLAGMSDVRPMQTGSRIQLVRPFLPVRRKTIEALCEARGFETRTDSTNLSTEFTRGRIRTVVLPLLRSALNPNVDEALLRLAELARGMSAYLEDAAARTFDSLLVSESPGRIVLNTVALLSKQRIVQAEIVRRAVALVLGGEEELGFSHLETVLRLAEDSSSGKELHLPGPVLVRKQYDRLEFRPLSQDEPSPELASVFVQCPGRTPLPGTGFELSAEIRPLEPGKIDELRRTPHPHEEWIDFERVRLPLIVRGRRDGDRFRPLGAPGAKTLSDFLGDEKVDPQTRARTGVLCDQDGPIWVMPLRIDERVKLRPGTRTALRLVLSPAAPRSGDAS